ncbi:MAG: UDP-N-acetylglucosamine--N-acetylmuramyl-(pentapeptide) pyrophosphoryl-undecaprenol N-acetylglucosamine transferase [Elusimicrobiota bacterium]|jgi:UDP-N-acetylglucosamine--N-acetylmuramyl-(pentapeptide) pyrophosphoryl-undecaprenol N-acetylglucosamine transferase
MSRRIVIAAGGTGGHFYPGLVLAQELRRRGWQPLLIVRRGDPALARLAAEDLPAVELDLHGLSRRPGPGWLTLPWKLLRSWGLAGRILRDFDPNIVVGMGGYLTLPAVLAARLRGIPCAVHESNSVLGLANRAAAALGSKIFRGLPPAPGETPGTLTGTPVRPALWTPGDARSARLELGLDPAALTVLVFGGSQGARGLNQHAPAALARAAGAGAARGLQVLHLAGAQSAEAVAAAYRSGPLRARVLPYLEAMDKAYAAADVVVSRAGASTLAELDCLRKPAVLVPYPNAAGAHQEANARILAAAGAARMVLEHQLPDQLAAELTDLLSSPSAAEQRRQMSAAYARLGLPNGQDAVQRLTAAVEGAAE